MLDVDIDFAYKKKGRKTLLKRIGKFCSQFVTVGVHREQGKKPVRDGIGSRRINLAMVAYQNEFGWKMKIRKANPFHKVGKIVRIRARSFVRSMYRNKILLASIKKVIKYQVEWMLQKKLTPRKAWVSIGAFVRNLMKSNLSKNKRALAKLTVKLKGHSKPLYESGLLYDSIEFKVWSGKRFLKRESKATNDIQSKIDKFKKSG